MALEDTVLPALAETAPQLSNEVSYGQKWVDIETGATILGSEAEILTENLGWANLYFRAALQYLAQYGPAAGTQAHRDAVDAILKMTAFIRGSALP